MKTIELPLQQRLFDPLEGVIGPMGRKMIDNGWQRLFRQVLLEQMPVGLVSEGLSDCQGRPSVELHAITALLLIREFQGWTVPQTHEALLFRTDIQFALNLELGTEITQRTGECSVIWILCDGLGLMISFPMPWSLKHAQVICPLPKKPRGSKLLMNTPTANALPKSFAS